MFIYTPDTHLEAACRRVHGGNVLAVTYVLYRKLGRGIPESAFGGCFGYGLLRVLPREINAKAMRSTP